MSEETDGDEENYVPFGPPKEPVEVQCVECGGIYMSDRIELRPDTILGGSAWCCPMTGCNAAGFGFDLLPTDPNYRDENGGWVELDDEDEFEALGDSLPPADAPDELKRPDDSAERRRRLFGNDDVRHDDMPF